MIWTKVLLEEAQDHRQVKQWPLGALVRSPRGSFARGRDVGPLRRRGRPCILRVSLKANPFEVDLEVRAVCWICDSFLPQTRGFEFLIKFMLNVCNMKRLCVQYFCIRYIRMHILEVPRTMSHTMLDKMCNVPDPLRSVKSGNPQKWSKLWKIGFSGCRIWKVPKLSKWWILGFSGCPVWKVPKLSKWWKIGFSGNPRNRRDLGTPENIKKCQNESKRHLQDHFWMPSAAPKRGRRPSAAALFWVHI